MVEQLSFKKLSADTRKLLRTAMVDLVLNYWQKEKLIPEGNTIKSLEIQPLKKFTTYPGNMPRTVMS